MPADNCQSQIAQVIGDVARFNQDIVRALADVIRTAATDPAAATSRLRQISQQIRQGQFPGVGESTAAALDAISCA